MNQPFRCMQNQPKVLGQAGESGKSAPASPRRRGLRFGESIVQTVTVLANMASAIAGEREPQALAQRVVGILHDLGAISVICLGVEVPVPLVEQVGVPAWLRSKAEALRKSGRELAMRAGRVASFDRANLPHELEPMRQTLEATNSQAIIVLPLVVKDRCLGLLLWTQTELGDLAHADSLALQAIGEMITIGLENTLNYAELLTSGEQFDRIIEDAPIGMVVQSLDGRFERVNKAFCALTGYSPSELTHRSFRDITLDKDLETDEVFLGRLLAGELPSYSLEKRYIAKDGRHIEARIHRSLVRDRDGRPRFFLTQVLDIRKEKEAQWACEAFDRVREEWLATITHDIRQPLTTIGVRAAVLEKKLAGDAWALQQLAQIEADVKRVSRLIGDLYESARLAAGTLSMEKKRLDLVVLLRRVSEGLGPLLAGRSLDLKLPTQGVSVWADAGRLARVMDNLLSNAVKYSPAGSRIQIGLQRLANEAIVCVENQGAGIPADGLEHVFERYARLEPTRRSVEGAGLGLAIVKGIVAAHGGRSWARSHPGAWTAFFIALPVLAD